MTAHRIGRAWCLLIALGVAAPAHAEELTLDAGALRAVVQSDPWRVTFTDRDGNTVLAEAADLGVGPSGPLGFRTAGGWVHGVRALTLQRDGGALTALVETNDALHRRLAVRLARDAEA